MNRIQEVVHKFRSGSTEKRESSDVGGGGRRAGDPRATGAGGPAVGRMTEGGLRTVSSGSLLDQGLGQTRWYVEPPLHGSSSATYVRSAERSELSALPVLTPSGLQQTMLAALGRSDPVATGPDGGGLSQQPPSPEKKATKVRPKGTLEYKVANNDTLEKIAARFDVTPSELKKLNRMSSRMVFESQILYIPDPDFVPSDPPTPEPVSPVHSPVHQPPKLDLPIVKMADKPPAHVPGHVMKIPSPPLSAAPVRPASPPTLPRVLSEDEAKKLDEECYERFIKVATEHICEGFNKVQGTLLVTPNAIMFDPDVLKEGEMMEMKEAGGVVVYMDTIISADLYHDLSGTKSRAQGSTPKDPDRAGQIHHDDAGQKASSLPDLPVSSSPQPLPSDISAGRLQPSVTGESSLTNQNVPGLSHAGMGVNSDIDAMLRVSGENVSIGELSAASLQTGKEGRIQIVGDVSQKSLGGRIDLGDLGGESSTDVAAPLLVNLDSKDGATNAPPIKDVFSQETTQQGDQLLSFTGIPVKRQDKDDEDRDAHLPDVDEAEIQALLAGGRRDSMGAAATASDVGKIGNIFYPTSPEEVGTAGQLNSAQVEENPDALVRECADKLVSEILESVSWSSGLNTAATALALKPETAGDAGDTCPDWKKAERESETEKTGDAVMAEGRSDVREAEPKETVTVAGQVGEERTASSAGPVPDRKPPTVCTDNSMDGVGDVGSTENVTQLQTTSAKHKPDPLADFLMDSTDGNGSFLPESAKSRPESGTFSPLRSSVQHLTHFVDSLFRGGSAEERPAGKTFDIPVVREKGAGMTRVSDEGREKGSREAETVPFGMPVGASSTFYVKSAAHTEERGQLLSQSSDVVKPDEESPPPPPSIYLHLNVDAVECDRRFNTWSPSEASPHAKTRPHYWFSFPRHKADHLYAFFVQWQPDAFGDDEVSRQKHGFVIVSDMEAEQESETQSAISEYFGPKSSDFKKDWEIISREEAIRRGIMSVDRSNMPELTHQSSILSEQHILQLSNSLPPRTIGYKWSLAYSTNLHGFSLKRLYREVARIDSPILLVLRDTENTVFGAFLSEPPKLSDHFFGTGMCQLWTFKDKFRSFCWTGDNVFFIKGDENSMSVGAGQGVYGLWLDSDLYHGRSHQCSTFNNIVLSATEDFCISALEAWSFVSD